jgi:hypothetical protein
VYVTLHAVLLLHFGRFTAIVMSADGVNEQHDEYQNSPTLMTVELPEHSG